MGWSIPLRTTVAVSYTHLDVYKRQAVVVAHILVEGVERGDDAPVSPDTLDIGVQMCIRDRLYYQLHRLESHRHI